MSRPDSILANEEAAVVAFSALVFGVSLCTFIHCLRWLLFTEFRGWKLKKHINWALVTVALLIVVFSSLCLALDIRSLMDRLLFISEDPPGESYSPPGWMSVLRCAAANVVALLADVVLIHRCWVIYEHSLQAMIVPVVLWLGGVACTGTQAYFLIAHIQDVDASPYVTWGIGNISSGPGIAMRPFWGLTVVLNAYATFMLTRRLHRFVRRSAASSQQLLSIMRILAESGTLYLSVTLAHFITLFFNNVLAIRAIGALNTPIIGIAFHLVIIRAAQNRIVRTEASVDVISEIKFNSNATQTVHSSVSAGRSLRIASSGSTDSTSDTESGFRSYQEVPGTRGGQSFQP